MQIQNLKAFEVAVRNMGFVFPMKKYLQYLQENKHQRYAEEFQKHPLWAQRLIETIAIKNHPGGSQVLVLLQIP
jgi:hypothetical protein